MGGGEGEGGVAKAATPLYKTHNIRNHLNTEVIEAGYVCLCSGKPTSSYFKLWFSNMCLSHTQVLVCWAVSRNVCGVMYLCAEAEGGDMVGGGSAAFQPLIHVLPPFVAFFFFSPIAPSPSFGSTIMPRSSLATSVFFSATAISSAV